MSNKNVFAPLGATNHSIETRHPEDYYATPPIAVEKLLEVVNFESNVWETACGEGHISQVLTDKGYTVYNSDIIDRGFKNTKIIDFLQVTECPDGFDKAIVTNPPYKYALEFVQKGYDLLKDGGRMAMLLRLNFLEGQKRRLFFDKHPPNKVLVFSKRIDCAINGDFSKKVGAQAYAWFVWEKGKYSPCIIEWI